MTNEHFEEDNVPPSSKLKSNSIEKMPLKEVVARIENLNRGLADFWSQSDGWAPAQAAGLLGKSRLDWQVSLSASLRLWIDETEGLSDGELILAWVNLGSLIEGTIKLLLSAFYSDYKADIEGLKAANAFDHKKGEPQSPDGLSLETLRKYCKAQKLCNTVQLALMEKVQQRRNAVHAFKDRPIGDSEEFHSALRAYLPLLRAVVDRLPFPGEMYVPQE